MATFVTNQKKRGEDSVASGTFYLLTAQLFMLIAGYAIHVFLGRRLQPSAYGLFGVVMALLTWLEVSLTGGFPYSIRKLGAENPSRIREIARTAFKGQIVYAMFLFVIAELLAPVVAAILHEPRLTLLIRIASLDIPIYALYYVYLGVLNGQRTFKRQSIPMGLYAGVKIGAVLLLVIAGWGVTGALIGNILASVMGFGIAVAMTGRIGPGKMEPLKNLISFAASTAAIGIIFTLLINIDLFAVKALIKDSNQVGYYVAASTLAKTPFLLFVAISSAILPAVSKAVSVNNQELARNYVSQAFRLHIILLFPLTALVMGSAKRLVELIYGYQYTAASSALALLMLSFMFYGLLNTINNMLLATGETRKPLFCSVALVLVVLAICILLIPQYGLMGGAIAATTTGIIGMIIETVWVYLRFGQPIATRSVINISIASTVIYLSIRAINVTDLWLLPVYAALGGFYALILVCLRELTQADLKRLPPILRGNKA